MYFVGRVVYYQIKGTIGSGRGMKILRAVHVSPRAMVCSVLCDYAIYIVNNATLQQNNHMYNVY